MVVSSDRPTVSRLRCNVNSYNIIFSELCLEKRKTPHRKGEARDRQILYFNLHPAGQPEDDPVLVVAVLGITSAY